MAKQMLEGIRRTYRLRQLERGKIRLLAAYAKDIRDAKVKKTRWEDIESIEADERWEVEQYQDEIEHLHTEAIVREANRLRLPLPENGWERSQQLGYRYLSDHAYAELRRTIRNEKRERWEARLQWLPSLAALITAIGGILGILIGLVSVLKH